MVTSSGSNNRYGQGLVSFRELDGGQRSPPMGLFSKILERVRNTMASEPSSSQTPPLVTSPLSVNSETESSSNYHPFQSIHAVTSNSSHSKNVQNISAPFISSSTGFTPSFSSSSVVGLDVAKATPSISYKENKASKTSEKSPSSVFSFSSAIPSFFQVPNNKRKQPISSEPEIFDEEPVETQLEPYSNHDSPKRTNSIKNASDSQPSLILSPPENHDPPRNPFYQLGEAAQGSATSFFSSRPSDAMTMILRRLQGQGEGLNRDYWMKDEHCHSCYNCDRTFNPLLRRKHHCRICGQIFCSECTSKLIPGDSLGQPGLIKVCDYCYRLRQTYQSSGRLLDVNSNTPSPSPGLNPSTSNNILSKDRKQDDSHYAKSPSGLAASKKENVEGLKRLLTAGTRVVDARSQEASPFRHRVALEEDNDSPLSPSDNLDSVLSNEAISDSPDSDAPYSMITGFKGSILANQLSDAGDLLTTNLPRSQSQVWRSLMQQNATSPNARKLMRKLTVTSIDPATPAAEYTRSKSTCEVQLNIASLQHIRRLLRELLELNQIDSSWEDIITSLALKAAHRLELNVKDGDSMDIRRYVKIKRIPGGSPSDSEYINGVVCSKALTHKTMLRTLVRPRILILTFPFEYQRVEYQFSSLDPLLAQESEHLKNMVARVLALRPTLVIVEKSIARIALDFLHKANLCVAMNVKPSVIRALARCTQAEVISSLEKLRQEPKLGDCQKFEVRTYMHELIPQWRKSYFFFHGCKPSLGCTLVLRGGDIQLLGKLKRVTELITYAAYCLKLETVLLRDQLAMIPNQLNSSTSEQTINDSQDNVSEKPLNADLDEKDIDTMLQPYRIKTLSTSPFVKFPPPYLLLRMKEESIRIRDLEEKHKLVMASKVAGSLSSPHPEDDIPDSRLEIGLSLQKDSAAAVEEHLQNLRAHQVFVDSFQPPISPFAHQNITILYCNVSTTETTICQAPQSHTIEYYQSSDLTLGQFLELSCFDLSMLCGTCDKSVLKHLRSYVHGNARVTVTVEDLPSPITGMESTILMWSYCKLCDKVLPVVPMSEETWKFSLGKYLELSFYHAPLSCRAGMCPHDIHRDHVRYFGLRDLAARFEYEPIDLMEVRVPPTRLYFKPEISQRLKHQDFETLRSKINLYWDSVNEKVKVLLNYSISTAKPEQCRQELTEMSRRVAAERNYVLQVLQQTFVNSHPTDTLALNLVLRVIHEKVLEWDAEFSSITQKYLQTESDLRRLTSHQLRRLFPDRDILGTDTTQHQQFLRDLTLEGPVKESMQPDDTHLDMFPHLSSSPSDTPGVCFFPDALDHLPTRQSYVPVMNPVIYRRHSLKLMREERSQREERAVQSNSSPSTHAPITPLPTGDKSTDDYLSAGSKRFIPRVTPSFGPGGSARASIFDDPKVPKNASAGSLPRLARPNSNKSSPISRGTPRVNINTPTSTPRGSSRPPAPASTLLSTPTSRGPASLRVSKPRPGTRSVERRISERVPRSGSTENTIRSLNERKIKRSATTATSRPSRLGRPSIAVYSNARDAVEEESDSEEDSRPRGLKIGGIHGAYPGLGDMELSSTSPDADDFGANPALGVLGLGEEVFSVPTPSLMPEISREEDPLPSEFSSDAPPPETRDNAYDRGSIIQTLSTFLGGPSSIGLVSLEYPIQPTEHLFADSPIVIREDEPSSVIAFTLSSRDYLEQMKKIQNSPPDSPDRMVERELQAKDGTHLRYQLGEGAIRMTCKVFFAHHFDALRRHCDQDGLFIESLARCVKWSASGGKSGSIFLKTRDDRLVMKEVSKAELDAFLKFAPLYFSHMAEALFEGLPALLAKIFGLYRISIKNIHTGRSMRIDVLIIENLFYERRISRIFDLKGSLRNRLVQSTGKENEVLLDENLMEIICHSPIFIRAHSKQLLHMAIFNDTKFLSSLKVMDYSLLVGIDEERNELVVGMVDFIRTFTWDKKLESWVKENAFLGGREQPTIVSPSLYKHRFRGFMDKYFLMVPDKYYIPSIELKLPRTSN